MKTNDIEFRKELEALINRTCMENGSDTPDFVLAQYLFRSLHAFDEATRGRERFYGREKKETGGTGPVPKDPTQSRRRGSKK